MDLSGQEEALTQFSERSNLSRMSSEPYLGPPAYNPVFALLFMKINILHQITGIYQASITLKAWHLLLDGDSMATIL